MAKNKRLHGKEPSQRTKPDPPKVLKIVFSAITKELQTANSVQPQFVTAVSSVSSALPLLNHFVKKH